MARRTAVLALTYAPDDRRSSRSLRDTLRILRRRGIPAELWFLMNPAEADLDEWDDPRVVDDLRTWGPAAKVDAMLIPRLGMLMRGQLLRHWLRQLNPTIIILDDGVGSHVAELAPAHTTVLRINDATNGLIDGQRSLAATADIVVAPEDRLGEYAGQRVLEQSNVVDPKTALEVTTPEVRLATRRRLDIPVDVPLVAGWGLEGWLDGPELFPRILLAANEHFDTPVHGLWLCSNAEPYERDRLAAEAKRCGVDHLYHQRADYEVSAQLCSEVAMLPARTAVDSYNLQVALAAGLRMAAFEEAAIESPHVRIIANRDIDAAGAALAELLDDVRRARSEPPPQLPPDMWIDALLDLAAASEREQ